MLYLVTSSSPAIAAALDAHEVGRLVTAASGNRLRAGWLWALDNGAYSNRWDPQVWAADLGRRRPRAGCLWAAVPDVVADADSTSALWQQYAPAVRAAGYPCAYVLQDGLRPTHVPWDEVDAVFVGGTTEFKDGPVARAAAREAHDRGVWVHVGRVNTWARMERWAPLAHSMDGTMLSYGPDKNFPILRRWLERLHGQPQLDLAAP